jgi:hypothetical protein
MRFEEATIIRVRNVNQALSKLRMSMKDPRRDYFWRDISPRGMQTMEYRGVVTTEYSEPTERVLWSPHRDANPFFHLMEALWILAGRADVEFLAAYNKQMRNYSDNGSTFHAPYGFRLRNHFIPDATVGEVDAIDQVRVAIELLSQDHSTRQVVLSIWDPAVDLGAKTKDMPCNDMVMFKIRDGHLNMTVCCRSNDALWGAYGANVVQFSVLQEFIASAIDVPVGVYRQISDSFHVYTDQAQETWRKIINSPDWDKDYYQTGMQPFPLMSGFNHLDWKIWLQECEDFCNGASPKVPFFKKVAVPMREAWVIYHSETDRNTKVMRAQAAIDHLSENMVECDWRLAAMQWIARRAGRSE